MSEKYSNFHCSLCGLRFTILVCYVRAQRAYLSHTSRLPPYTTPSMRYWRLWILSAVLLGVVEYSSGGLWVYRLVGIKGEIDNRQYEYLKPL